MRRTFLLLVIGNGPVFPVVAYYLRHGSLTSSTWRSYLTWSLVVGVVLPLLVVAAVGLVAVVRRNPDRRPLPVLLFAVFWSAPGLISCHNAISDLRHGPAARVERVEGTARVDEYVGSNTSHVWHTCRVTFDDGSKRELWRYAVKYSTRDPCHGIQDGDSLRLVVLPHVDELVAIDDLGGAKE